MSYVSPENQMLEAMKGRKIESVEVWGNKEFLTISFQDGHVQHFVCEGDCCSHTWIEHFECPPDIAGATYLGKLDLGEWGALVDSFELDNGDTLIQIYQTLLQTDKGDISVEYRNSSNGYYGGSLDPVKPDDRRIVSKLPK